MSAAAPSVSRPDGSDVQRLPRSDIALVDLLDRLLGTGVVLSGEVVITLAGVDLVEIKLAALITSVRAEMERRTAPLVAGQVTARSGGSS